MGRGGIHRVIVRVGVLIAAWAALLISGSLAEAAIPTGGIQPDNGIPGTEVSLSTACDLPAGRQLVYLELRSPNEIIEDPTDPRLAKVALQASPQPGSWTFKIPDIAAGEYWVRLECAPGQLFGIDNGKGSFAQLLMVRAASSPTTAEANAPKANAPKASDSTWPIILAAVAAAAIALGLVVRLRRSRPS